MTAPASLPALIAEGRRLIAENDGKHRYCTMDPGPHAALRMLPALLDVAEAGDKIAGYLEEEMLDAKTCVGQDVVTGEPCEWHKMLLALDSALSKLRGVRS